ncbi:hypothetical protein [Embleya sp. AB8]|uniref:hypothetical protein n=1 Tax=Embleya sp. AB8 TaxID=3156304 RepID=UPI003C7753D8
MTTDQPQATHLTPERIAELRDTARREAGPFVNPKVLNTPIHNAEWASTILGRAYCGPRSVTWQERYLLYIATRAEPAPPPPPRATAARARYRAEEETRRTVAHEKHRKLVAVWEAMAETLRKRHGVRVEVRHNYTSSRHLDGFTQGVDHVYLLDALTAGRLRRDAGRVLCWTPSRARDLQVLDDPNDDRLPTCRACLRIAHGLTNRPV